MVDNVTTLNRQEPPDIVGPDRSGSAVIIEGRKIPDMHCHDRGESIEIIIDGRFSYEFPKEWAFLAAHMAAQAMAVGAGYPSLNAETRDRPFAPQCFKIKLGESDNA